MFRLQLLGTVQVERDGKPIRGFRSRKALALLGYLAMQDQPVPREHLADLFWGDQREARGRANLSWVLNRISTLLPDCLQADRHTVQFQRTASYWLDLDAFAELEAQGDVASLTAAMELYRGEFLEGLYLDGCAEFEIWLVQERERWRQRVTWVLEKLITHHGQRGEYQEGLRFARRLLALEPWREETHCQVMRLLARSGQRTAALAQYEACRRVLAEELGIEPLPETTALYERIQAATLARKHNLPVQLTPFVGRETTLAEIRERLDDPACRLLTLVGPGGSGKTRLALQTAERLVKEHVCPYAHGIFFVSLAPLDTVEAIVPTVAQALDYSFYAAVEPQQQLLDYLCQKEMLLILDSLEHLSQGANLLTKILKTAPKIKILATSRVRLNVGGEHLYHIAGMNYPRIIPRESTKTRSLPQDAQQRDDALQYSAVKLFLQTARRAQPNFELTDENLSDVVQICHLVGGMPLGIQLAAAWVNMLTPAEIATEICRNLDFLETDRRDVPERQRSVRAVFDHSWELLTKREQEVFCALSVFRGGFSREAAQQVSGASLRELMALVNKSLLQRAPAPLTLFVDKTEGRHELHELLRYYAAGKLSESPPASDAARDRHCAYYAAALQQWALDLKGPRQQEALAEMDVEIENVRVSWDWAVEREYVERLDQALEGLCLFYSRRGRYQEGQAACRAAVQQLETMADYPWHRPPGQVSPRSEAEGDGLRLWSKTRAWQSVFWQHTETKQMLEHSLTLLESYELAGQDTRPEQAFVLERMGDRAIGSDHVQARQFLERSLALYRELDDRWGTAHVLILLGEVAWSSGAYGKAKQLYQQSLKIFQALGDQIRTASSLRRLSMITLFQGQFEEAERLVRESVKICQEMNHQAGRAVGLGLLSLVLTFLGKLAEGHSQAQESVAAWQDLGGRDALAFASFVLGFTKMHLGRHTEAYAQANMGLALARKIGDQRLVGLGLYVLGSATLAEQVHAKARQLLQESIAAFREAGPRDELGWALAACGYATRGLGQPEQAKQYIHEALQIAAEIGAFIPLMHALPAIALLLADQGEAQRALELYSLASRYPFVANSRWFEDVAGQHIAAVAAGLPPEVVAAAQERGRTRDLWTTAAELLTELGKEHTSFETT